VEDITSNLSLGTEERFPIIIKTKEIQDYGLEAYIATRGAHRPGRTDHVCTCLATVGINKERKNECVGQSEVWLGQSDKLKESVASNQKCG